MASAQPEKKLRSGTKPPYILQHTDHQIVGSKLPSNRQVLSVFLHNMREFKLSQINSASLVIDESMIFWEKAKIPTSAKWYCVKKLEDLYDQYRKLQKAHTVPTKAHIEREKEFMSVLDDLFDIASADALEKICEVDKQFLLAQRKKGREGCMIGIDKKSVEKEERKRKELESEARRKAIAEQEKQRFESGK